MQGADVLRPMPKEDLIYTGHYIDHELVSNIEADCEARRARKREKKPMRFLLTIGGAGAQRDFCFHHQTSAPAIEDGRAALYVNVGDYRNVWEELLGEIPGMKNFATEHFNNWKDTTEFAAQALTGEVSGIHGFWHEEYFRGSLLHEPSDEKLRCACDKAERAGILPGAEAVYQACRRA